MASASTFELFFRLALSLAIVMGLMWGLARIARRRGFGPSVRRTGPQVEIELLARRTVGRNASIAVVRAGGKAMVVGITEREITKLDDADVEEIDLEIEDAQWTAHPEGRMHPGSAWRAMLDQLRERTTRR